MDGFILQIASRAKKGAGKKPASSDSEGSEDAAEESASEPEGHDGIITDALDKLAGILKVSKDDRDDFDAALTDLAEAVADRCVAEATEKPAK